MKRDPGRLASQRFDVLIVGGGIHGAVVAWDAALRGLSVALIERSDFGSGASQNSLKIIHGGLRYLQDGNISRIRTMARERTTWMKIAPHLVHPLTCLMPTRKKLSRSRLVMRTALAANDLLSFDRNQSADPEKHLAGGQLISQQELSDLLPGYDCSMATGAAVWHDAQVHNTERLLLSFILAAAQAGATLANYLEATSLIKTGNQITGVQARDAQTGEVFAVQARIVINCTGAWIDDLLGTTRLQSNYATSIAINIIVNQIWSGVAAGLPSRSVDGRKPQILFFVPWRNNTMIGTRHIPWHDAPTAFTMSEEVIQDFLDEVNSVHPSLSLTLEDVQHITWGFLPVNYEDAHHKQVKLTRDGVVIDHDKRDGVSGLISVLGVKYTTARAVAEQAVDLLVKKLGARADRCKTHTIPVYGGCIDDFQGFLEQALSAVSEPLDQEMITHLVSTHGSAYLQLVRYNLSQRIDANLPVIQAEVLHAVRQEMALTLLDVIQRRTELGATGLPTLSTLQKCADWMGYELGWTRERRQQEIDSVVQAYPFKKAESVIA